MWLDNPVREKDGQDGRPGKGTPQGGVISPLLANIDLYEFDRDFHEDPEGPLGRANARLVGFADDMVVMARYMGRDLKGETVHLPDSNGMGSSPVRGSRAGNCPCNALRRETVGEP